MRRRRVLSYYPNKGYVEVNRQGGTCRSYWKLSSSSMGRVCELIANGWEIGYTFKNIDGYYYIHDRLALDLLNQFGEQDESTAMYTTLARMDGYFDAYKRR